MKPLFEEAKQLGEKIAFYTARSDNRHVNYAPIRNDLKWGAAYLYAELLFHAKERPHYAIDDTALHNITEQFIKETGKTIDTTQLFSKGLLRRVYQLIMLPAAVSTYVFQARQLEEVLDTYRFLLHINKQKPEGPVTVEQLQELALAYEKQQDCKLNLDKARKYAFWQEKDGKISYPNLEPYRELYEERDTYLYLQKLYDIYYTKGDENCLYVESEELKAIIEGHRKAFPDAPNLAKLIEDEMIIERADFYIIRLINNESFPADRIWDRIAAILWLKLRDSAAFPDDAARLRRWYLRIIHRAHWCDIQGMLRQEDMVAFLQVAAQAVLTDPDLSSGDDEYHKIIFDHRERISFSRKNLAGQIKSDPFPVHDDLFVLYKELQKFDRNGQRQLFIIQSARGPLSYFIRQIVANELDPWAATPCFPLIMDLLTHGAAKPYILWSVCNQILNERPAIIPFLAVNEQTASLGCSLLWKIELNKNLEDSGRAEKLLLLSDYMRLVTHGVATVNSGQMQGTYQRKADILFQCLLLPTLSKFYLPQAGSVPDQEKEKEFVREAVTALRRVVEETQVQYAGYAPTRSGIPLFHPLILLQLYQTILAYTESDFLQNGTLSLPLCKLDYLMWLLRLVEDSPISEPALLFNTTSAFLRCYLDPMNQTEIEAGEFGTNTLKRQLPLWSTNNEGIEYIDWAYGCLVLSRQNQLEVFLSPANLLFSATSDPYNAANRFTANKLRTHLAILILAYNNIYNNIAQLQVEQRDVNGVLCILEYRITAITSWYCVQDESQMRVDIFENLLERAYFPGARNRELLPNIGHTINKFTDENKRKIIREMLHANQLIRSLKLLEYVISEQDKQDLLASISTELITREIGRMGWYEEEYALSQLAEYQRFKDKIMEVLAGLEEMIRSRKGPWQEASVSVFRLKLRLAFQDGDLEEIDRIGDPGIDQFRGQRVIPASERDFYRALTFLKKNEPDKAYHLFKEWIDRFSHPNPSWALNRFASKNQWARNAEKIEDKKKLYYEAVKEWIQFEGALTADDSLEYLKENIWYNKLEAWHGAQFDLNFDKQFFDLEKVVQLSPNFLSLRIQNYTRRNMHVQALMLLNEAERYHQLGNGNLPEFIAQLRQIAYTDKSEAYLRAQYELIFSSAPETLVKIIHRNINKYETLPLFILQEICASANAMLTYVNSITDIKLEDKYSDLLTLSLRARLMNYNWFVGPARGSYSESQKLNPGEIDFAINSTSERIAICEAMRLHGKDTTTQQSHAFKVFNYDASRKFLYLIIYYLGPRQNFHRDWESYRHNCEFGLEYPVDFGLISGSWEEMPDFTSDTVKVSKTRHEGGCTLYHLFINIDYLVAHG